MNDMNLQQLKDYLKCVFGLEVHLYKHKLLVDGYRSKRARYEPIPPRLELPLEPSKPNLQEKPENKYVATNWQKIVCTIFSILSIWAIWITFPSVEAIILLICNIVLIPCIFVAWIPNEKLFKKENDRINKENTITQKQYEEELEHFRQAKLTAYTEYDKKMKEYRTNSSQYATETSQNLYELGKLENSLQDALNRLYSQNIIYAKYRNIVAISTIYEYFDSGRCTELEGPNGAYNMYEGELRSNIIICSLSQIISDLEQIKNGQYALYEQINRSNLEVTRMLNNIYDAQMLTAYYAEAAAIAASADKYTVGVIY